MKLSKDQKKMAKYFAISPFIYIAYTVVYHLIKGDVNWMDILWMLLVFIAVNVLLCVFYLLGSKTPEK